MARFALACLAAAIVAAISLSPVPDETAEAAACPFRAPGNHGERLTSSKLTDCFRVRARPGQLTTVTVTFDNTAVDMNLRVIQGGRVRGLSDCDAPIGWGCTGGRETLSMYGFLARTATVYRVEVFAYAHNPFPGPYRLGISTARFNASAACNGLARYCRQRLAFPVPWNGASYFHNDGVSGANTGSLPQYRWGQRRALEAFFYAANFTARRFANEPPLGMVDIGGVQARTPGFELSPQRPRHPQGTHLGNDLDVAYYRRAGANNAAPVCPNSGGYCTGPPRIDARVNAFFISKLVESPHIRIIIVDPRIGRMIEAAARNMFSADPDLVRRIERMVCWGGDEIGGRFHHHHMHISFFFGPPTGEGCA
ncbi:MAG: hypothetical protein GEU28_06675 [Dehalococcoidia bacterium]|nr:hypothetical protein [Dehalococcoidia bacterium]